MYMMFLIIDKRKDNNSTQNSVGQVEQVRESVLFSLNIVP